MELRYMPRGKPHLKGGIERTMGTISREFLSFLPGRTFSNPVARGDYDSAGRAAATFEKVNELLTIYFVDVVHNRTMGALLGRTPLQTWDALAGFGVRMPPNADDLTAILSLVVDRTVTSVGITFLGLVYQSKELQGVRRRVGHLGKLLMVKIDPNDIGSILVMDEGDANRKGKWISVPCIYPELADGVTVAQWKETVALARQETEPGRRVALATLRSARRRLAEEGARLGAKPLNATVNDVDWAREHVDDPDFDVARDSEAGGGRRKRGRPRKVDGQAVDRKVGDGGHLRQPDNDPASLAIADAGAEDAVREVADSGTSGGNDPLPPSEQKQQAADRQSGAGRKRVDYGDPDNWK
jgi:putative transposase